MTQPSVASLRTGRHGLESLDEFVGIRKQADTGKPAALVNFVGRAVERSLNLYLEACTPATAPPRLDDEWISLREAADGTPYSQEYLSLLARSGRIEAVKRGRVWFTSRKAVEEYRKSVEQG